MISVQSLLSGVFLPAWLAAGWASAAQAQAARRPVNQSDDPLLREFLWRSIGPAVMSGRIDDIEAVESDPSVIYIGFATGGVWKSTNMGTTWTPIFDTYAVSSIGDLAVAPSHPDVIYVGTGECNNRQSTTIGNGMYRSTDGGRSFVHIGLDDTHHICRVVVDPRDPDVVYVAAMGKLWGPNRERGLYKTSDGGRTWTNTNFVDEYTGFTEVVMHPRNPDILFAASYQRQRTSWGFNGGGRGSGIWRTQDGGRTWTRLSGGGLPSGYNGILGRIGLAFSRSNPDIVYAQIEVGNPNPPAPGDPDPDPTRSGVWKSTDGGRTWAIQSNNNNRPMYYSQVRVDPSNPDIVYTMGASFYKSTDGARNFVTVGGMGHGDHHALWINPSNPRHLMLGTDGGFNFSWDEGATWDFVNTQAVGQFYAIGVDMRRPYYVCGGLQDNGSWCGPSATRTSLGIANHDWYRVGGGDGFYTRIDPTDHQIVYSESQNGAMSRRDHRTGQSKSIRPTPPVVRNNVLQPGNVLNGQVGDTYRFNWNTPLVLSPHDPSTVYTGANRFFRSTDRGETWWASDDLTKAIDRNALSIMGVRGNEYMASKNDGQANYGSITTLAESPSRPGLIWVGTDDGNVQVSFDGGKTFANVAPAIPGPRTNYQVSRVAPSAHNPAVCYVALDNHRYEDWNPYLFVTRDYGKTWQSIAGNLPRGNINVVVEDPKNPHLLYVGTEFGLFLSLDGGKEWKRFQNGLPTVRVDDLLVHPRDNDLVVGTHGRSIYILDDITPLQQFTPEVAAGGPYLFEPRPAVQWLTNPQEGTSLGGSKVFRAPNPPAGTAIAYYLPRSLGRQPVTLTITTTQGEPVRTLTGPGDAGIHRVQWNLRGNPPTPAGGGAGGQQPAGAQAQQGALVPPGTYLVKMSVDGKEMIRSVVVLEDIWMGQVGG